MSKSLLMLCFHSRLNGRVILIVSIFSLYLGFPWWLSCKKFVGNMGDARNAGLIPGLGRFREKEMATHSRILAWRIPWTGSLVGYSS